MNLDDGSYGLAQSGYSDDPFKGTPREKKEIRSKCDNTHEKHTLT